MYPAYPPPSDRAVELEALLTRFLAEHVFPAEAAYDEYRAAAGPDDATLPPVVEDLKQRAKELGLWNLFLPEESGLTQLEYAPLAELTGWSLHLAPEATNCAAPDTGNMELLHLIGTDAQKERWLRPLLDGRIRSGFAMTEPAVASSDATNIETRIERDGDEYVINGRKWFTSGAADPRCEVLIVMGKTDPDAATHRQQSMVIVPRDTPGVTVGRSVPVFGQVDQHGHCVTEFVDVRVPVANLLGEEGGGFAAAQARLGPGRIHHVMRALGAGERALAMTVARAKERVAFGKPLAEQGAVRERIAESRIALDQARGAVPPRGVRHRQRGQQGRAAPGGRGQGGGAASRARGDRPGDPGARRARGHQRRPAGDDVGLAPGDAALRRSRRGAPDDAGPRRAHPRAEVRPLTHRRWRPRGPEPHRRGARDP